MSDLVHRSVLWLIREKNMFSNETINPKGTTMDNQPDTNETPEVIDTVAARTRVKNFLSRHQPKLRAIAILGGGAVAFGAGRKSKDYVEDVDVVVTTPDSNSDQS